MVMLSLYSLIIGPTLMLYKEHEYGYLFHVYDFTILIGHEPKTTCRMYCSC